MGKRSGQTALGASTGLGGLSGKPGTVYESQAGVAPPPVDANKRREGRGTIWEEYYPLIQPANQYHEHRNGHGSSNYFFHGMFSSDVLCAYRDAVFAYLVTAVSMTVLSLTALVFCKQWGVAAQSPVVFFARSIWLVSPTFASFALRHIADSRLQACNTPAHWNIPPFHHLFKCFPTRAMLRLSLLSYAIPVLCELAAFSFTAATRMVNPFNRTFVQKLEMVFSFNDVDALDSGLVFYVFYIAIVGIFWDPLPPKRYDFGLAMGQRSIGCSWFLMALVQEIGWSGSLFPALEIVFSHSTILASAITGMIWALWYWPMIIADALEIVPEGSGYAVVETRDFHLLYVLSAFTLLLVGSRIIMCWIQGNSCYIIWSSVIYHATHKLFIISVFGQLTAPLYQKAELFSFFSSEASISALVTVWFSTCILAQMFQWPNFMPMLARRARSLGGSSRVHHWRQLEETKLKLTFASTERSECAPTPTPPPAARPQTSKRAPILSVDLMRLLTRLTALLFSHALAASSSCCVAAAAAKHEAVVALHTPTVILRQVPFAATIELKELKNGTVYPRYLWYSIQDQDGALLLNGSVETMDVDGNLRSHWQVPVTKLKIATFGAHELTTTVMELTRDNTTIPFMVTLRSSVFVSPGWISLLPPLVTLVVSAALSQVLIALLAGIWVGATIVEQGNPFTGFLRTFDKYWVDAFINDGHAGVLLFTIVLGGAIGVVQKGGGGHGLALLAKQFMTTSLRMQLSTWLLCLLIFFDDYSCILIIGSSLRQVLSQTGVSREKFAAIIHTIGVCLPSMAPVSSWIGVEIGYVAAQLKDLKLDWDPFITCLSCLHYRFFPVLFIGLIFITIITEKDFGPMVQFEKDAATSPINADAAYSPLDLGPCASPQSELGALEPDTQKPLRWQNAVVPFLSIILLTFFGMIYDGYTRLEEINPDGDYGLLDALSSCNSVAALIRASAAGWVIAVVMLLLQRIVTIDEATKAWMEGVKDILDPTLILVLAWALGTVIGEVNVAPYVASVVGDQIQKEYLPAIASVLCFVVSFATGSAFGTMAIMFPIISPLSFTISGGDEQNLLQCFGSILGASVFGNTCSPIADTSILASLSAHIPLENHIRSIMPYALLVATLSVVGGSLPVALNVFSPFTAFAVCLGAMLLIVYFCGTRVNSRFRRLSSCSFLSASPPSNFTRGESESLLSSKRE